MNEDAVKRLNLMRFWLFGTFMIVWAATLAFTYMWIVPLGADFGDVVRAAAPVWVATAVLAVVWYLGYKWWLGRSEEESGSVGTEAASTSPPADMPQSEAPSWDEGGSEF